MTFKPLKKYDSLPRRIAENEFDIKSNKASVGFWILDFGFRFQSLFRNRFKFLFSFSNSNFSNIFSITLFRPHAARAFD
jgi:hypothetical protein